MGLEQLAVRALQHLFRLPIVLFQRYSQLSALSLRPHPLLLQIRLTVAHMCPHFTPYCDLFEGSRPLATVDFLGHVD